MRHLLINKNKPESFIGMPQREKKEFLSMDLIERMIRVEQRVSAHFGKFVLYRQTEYYKSLPLTAKDKFEKYLKWKKRRKILAILILFAPLILFSMFEFGISGRAVDNGYLSNVSLEVLLISGGLFVFIFVYLLIKIISWGKRNERFNAHFRILENTFFKH